jgi:serine/threonine protein kinase
MPELIIDDKTAYMFADREFYEPLTRYQPNMKDFCEPLQRIMPVDWALMPRDSWCYCSAPRDAIPDQGWKIHLSATPAHAPGILMTVARVLFEVGVSFKFIVDKSMLMTVNGKRWHRGAAGKFITVYPHDTTQCGELLEKLHQATIGYWGPYILSDRRYRDSQIVHYRYGGLLPNKRLDVSGRAVYVIQDANGEYVDDERSAYFHLPPGVEDPFVDASKGTEDDAEPGTLKNGRYKIDRMLAISNSGGVYLATDRQASRQVVIKEARPYTNVSIRGLDAAQLLKKEYRLLDLLADTAIAPVPYDFFRDWEHSYLVEEYLDGGITLRTSMLRMNLLLKTRPNLRDSEKFYRRYAEMFSRLAEIIRTIHDRHIVFSDLSMANVIVFENEDEFLGMKLIDFEGAYEEGVDLPTHLFTLGFSPEEAIERGGATRQDDYFAVGGLMMAGLFPMNSLMQINRNAHEPYLLACERDFDLPGPISALIRELLDPDPAKRPGPDRIIQILAAPHAPRPPRVTSSELDALDLERTIESTLSYIDSVADYERRDRLWPSDPLVFETNPLSIAHGACGIAYAMNRIRGWVDERSMRWILSQRIDPAVLPTGLYIGMSGIAWALLEIGLRERALEVIRMTEGHRLLWRSPDVFSGAAGWGMAQLRFFAETADESFLGGARLAAAHLIETREMAPKSIGPSGNSGRRCFWRAPEGIAPGYAHGAAGIGLFLLYLHLATGEEEYLSVATEAIEWTIAQAVDNPQGGMYWVSRDRTPSYTPYWRWGSSGIGRCVLRFLQVTGQRRYADLMEEIHLDADHKYTIFPGYFFGTAGICEMYMDMARFPRWENECLGSARKLLSGCMLFPVKRPGGLAFPGESISRLSCDFGTGGAGIALMMHRYRTRCGASFMLDHLIPGWTLEDRPASGEPPLRAASGA